MQNRLEGITTDQRWDNLSFKKNYDCNKLKYKEYKNLLVHTDILKNEQTRYSPLKVDRKTHYPENW